MILEGPMVIIACIALTVLHPGIGFQGAWLDADFAWRWWGRKSRAAVLVGDEGVRGDREGGIKMMTVMGEVRSSSGRA